MSHAKESRFLGALPLRSSSSVVPLREEKGWTLEETENYGWPSWRHLQRIETGHKNVTATTLLRVAKLYKVKLSDLLEGVD